jgi:hypothetical protein
VLEKGARALSMSFPFFAPAAAHANAWTALQAKAQKISAKITEPWLKLGHSALTM